MNFMHLQLNRVYSLRERLACLASNSTYPTLGSPFQTRVPWSRRRKKRNGGDYRPATVPRQGVPSLPRRHHYPGRVPPAAPTGSAPGKSRPSEGERGAAVPRRRVRSGMPGRGGRAGAAAPGGTRRFGMTTRRRPRTALRWPGCDGRRFRRASERAVTSESEVCRARWCCWGGEFATAVPSFCITRAT